MKPVRLLMLPVLLAVVLAVSAGAGWAAQLQLLLPLGRTAYQTNETIDIAVVRSDAAELPAADLAVTVTEAAGSKLSFSLPLAAVPAVNNAAVSTEHLHLNARLLRPGAYMVDVAANGATAQAKFDLFSHLRKSSFRIVDWGSRADGDSFPRMGEDSVGFNTILGEFRNGKMKNVEGAIRGGLDYMQVCTMSGAHQMDLRFECDWSDPYVLGGGAARGVQQAFISRTTPNALGVHFYDEPGLTWEGNDGPMGVTAQHRSFKSAWGVDPPAFSKVNADDPANRDAWTKWHNWHEGFMEAAWRQSAFGVLYTRPDFLPITQSVYGFTAYADGYYFNVVRSLPMISGHGGYSDGPGGYVYPAFHMEFGRMRDLNKPYWYLPSWYGMSSDNYRVEQYTSFQNNLQGMMKPPDYQVHNPATCNNAEGIVEANKIQTRLGTIFTTMPVTRPLVAQLYSMSQLLDGEMRDFKAGKGTGDWAYEGGMHGRGASIMAYMASKMIKVPVFPVVEEDILDGTLAKNHKVLVVPGVNYLPANVINALQGFIKGGGTVLVSDESKVVIPGAKKIGAALNTAYYYAGHDQFKDQTLYAKMQSFGGFAKELAPFAKALAARMKEAGIAPVIDCDSPGIFASRQAEGDIEYLFAVNATHLEGGSQNDTAPIETTIGLPADGRPVYDAVRGGDVAMKKDGNSLKLATRFGAGEMRVFARTARPIGGVLCLPPVQFCDYTVKENPLRVSLGAMLVDEKNRVLCGSAPLEIVVTDPLGAVRFDLYRATERGMLKLDLPLAANDPAGAWEVTVRELLTHKEDTASFTFTPATTCGALLGASQRAVAFGNERENIFRFFKLHKDITIATGSSDYNKAAAERLTATLAPWGVRCKIVDAKEINKPRQLTEEAKRTWCGLDAGHPDFANPAVSQLGFAVDGPVILLGTPEDNPLIKFALDKGFLPYAPKKDAFPGRGRGYLAWQDDMVGYFNQESVTCIAYDQAGMDEAAGTLYEICAGVEPLMPLAPPSVAEVTPATVKAATISAPKQLWRALLPDRVVGLQANGAAVNALSHDGTLTMLNEKNQNITKVLSPADTDKLAKSMATPLLPIAAKAATPNFVAKLTQPLDGGLTAISYWGGLLKVVDGDGKVMMQEQLPHDINAMTASQGNLVVGLSDGEVLCLSVK